MASVIASRIKARLSRRRHPTTPSLASSRSGLGKASSISSVPSQTSRQASCASHAQLTASQTSDEHTEPISHGAAPGKENGDANGNNPKNHDAWVADEADSGQPAEYLIFQRFGFSDSGGGSGAPGKKPLWQPEPPAKGDCSQACQVPQNNPMGFIAKDKGLADMHASDKDPPLRGHFHGSPRPASPSHPHPDPSQLNPASAAHLPPPSQSTPSPPSSPLRASHYSTLAVGDCNSPQCGAAGRTHLRLFDIGSSGLSGSGVRAPPADAADDLQIDPLQPSQHGREPDQLSLASFPTVAPASASVSSPTASPPSFATGKPQPPRRQSLFASRQMSLIKTLLRSDQPHGAADTEHRHSIDSNMVTRKIWVKRPNASATTITINEDDLVDDVRDMILRKYINSLGRTFDSPDLVIRVHPRDQEKERALGPEEVMARTLDTYYPGGQTIDEALIIDIPRRTPKASPRVPVPPGTTTTYYITEDGRPSEAGEGYFPPVVAIPSPHISHAVPATAPNNTVPHSIAVLGTGHIPPIPSPGAINRSRLYRDRPERPRLNRTHTSSPTLIAGHAAGPQAANAGSHGTQNFVPRLPHARTHSNSSDHPSGLAAVNTPMAKSPGPEATPARIATPPPRPSSPRAPSLRPRRNKKPSEYPTTIGNILNGSAPPINILIVEDNPINLKLLEAFLKKLKVRWQTAMNGLDAVKKWRSGGFHLVLMDIQLPVMNGLDATREIRRLERVNAIGVFTSTPATGNSEDDVKEQDRLQNLSLFKSPVIIVALTASSLQSDRHEALAAGCNDFLTKPVHFLWLERKVMEWGCMQALIDFDGWRTWKETYNQQHAEREAAGEALAAAKAKSKKSRLSVSAAS